MGNGQSHLENVLSENGKKTIRKSVLLTSSVYVLGTLGAVSFFKENPDTFDYLLSTTASVVGGISSGVLMGLFYLLCKDGKPIDY